MSSFQLLTYRVVLPRRMQAERYSPELNFENDSHMLFLYWKSASSQAPYRQFETAL